MVVTLPSSKAATGSSGRNSPVRRRFLSSSRARSPATATTRGALAAATLIATAANSPGIKAKKNAWRMPTIATSRAAKRGPCEGLAYAKVSAAEAAATGRACMLAPCRPFPAGATAGP